MESKIVINGITYVQEKPKSDDIRIVVLHRGNIVVGRYEQENDNEVVITNPSVIRRWGTTRGLGEIAAGGPTPETVLDPCGTVRVHPLAIIMTIDCEAQKWTSKLF